MDTIDKFLTDTAPVERRDLFMSTYNRLVTLGHVDHELNIATFVEHQGNVENDVIILLIENELVNACHDLALKYFIICRKEDRLNPYNHLLEFLDYIENTIESETILYYHNEELDGRDQFLNWVEVFREDLVMELSDFVLDVMPSLIENITETHELKLDHVPVEYDVRFTDKVNRLKLLRKHSNIDSLAMDLVRNNRIKTVLKMDDLFTLFSKDVYQLDDGDHNTLAIHIISLVIMSDNDVGSLNHDSKTLTGLLYDDLKHTNRVTMAIDDILNQTGELCKTMSTI